MRRKEIRPITTAGNPVRVWPKNPIIKVKTAIGIAVNLRNNTFFRNMSEITPKTGNVESNETVTITSTKLYQNSLTPFSTTNHCGKYSTKLTITIELAKSKRHHHNI